MPPNLTGSQVVNTSVDRGIVRTYIVLTYSTSNKAQVIIEVLSPVQCTTASPCPLFMTQTNHRKWASIGVSRGYVSCIYPGADADDQTDPFRLAYPEATWGLIARRAWLASRVLDYFFSADEIHIIRDQVAITGHSRNGKQSMIAAAFDERFTAVISSSSGAPAMSPYRFTSAFTFSEDPYGPWPNAPPGLNCSCTRNTDSRPHVAQCCWWLPSLVNYSGFENAIPIDSHALLGLIAPRFMLSQAADNDECDPTYAVERAYQAGKKAYAFLGKPDNLRVRWRPGEHHGFEVVASYFDWFDVSFSRIPGITVNTIFPEQLIHSFDWMAWNSSGLTKHSEPPRRSEDVETRIAWLTGASDQAVGLAWSPAGSYSVNYQQYVEEMLHRKNDLYEVIFGTAKMTISFGRSLIGTLYFPANKSAKSDPLVGIVWLHPFSYQQGYSENYPHDTHRTPWRLAAECNAVVLAFDQIGFGRRLREGRPSEFYRRWPNWSLLGHMVQDVQSAIDALLAPRDVQCPDGEPLSAAYLHSVPPVSHVTVVGYAMGAVVALHSSLIDQRIHSVAACAGISPFRNQTLAWQTGGNERLYDWHALLPRLGWFKGHESDVPYDYDDIFTSLKNRPTLLYAPQYDRIVDAVALDNVVMKAQHAAGKQWKLTYHKSNSTNKLDDVMQEVIISWVNTAVKGD